MSLHADMRTHMQLGFLWMWDPFECPRQRSEEKHCPLVGLLLWLHLLRPRPASASHCDPSRLFCSPARPLPALPEDPLCESTNVAT